MDAIPAIEKRNTKNLSEPHKNSKASFDRYGREDRYQHESLIPPVFFIDGIRISTVRYVQQRKLPRQPAVFQFPFDSVDRKSVV